MKKFKINFCFLFVSAYLLSNSTQVFSAEFNDGKDGQLHGKIVAPAGTKFSSVIIQVIGANQNDNFQYYTIPDEEGKFDFDGYLPGGSVVQLYIWDGSGVLNSTTLSAYVSPIHTKSIGVYEITMQEVQYTQNIAQIYNITHNLTSAGVCGFVGRYRRENNPGIKIAVYDRYAKYRGPLYEIIPNEKDQFCFFNLDSISGTDTYDFVILGPEGENKTFTYYLPPGTFLHDAFLDTNASLYRPIMPYFWKENDFSEKSGEWQKLGAVNLATSDDYSFVTYDEKKEDENLFYFPLTNELLEVAYFLNGENQNHFFFLLPRTKLFRDAKFTINENHERIYIDYDHPFPMKFITEEELIKLNSNYYFQTWNARFGSVFVNIDLARFGIEKSDDVELSLRNLAGQDIGTFNEVLSLQNDRMMGFFFNLFPGRYQIFLKNRKGELLWTYEVRSYANKVQVLANDLEQSRISPIKPQHYPAALERGRTGAGFQFYSENSNGEYIPEGLNSLQEEKLFLKNNIIYNYDADLFCKKIPVKKKNILDSLR